MTSKFSDYTRAFIYDGTSSSNMSKLNCCDQILQFSKYVFRNYTNTTEWFCEEFNISICLVSCFLLKSIKDKYLTKYNFYIFFII